jgi:hypothetical protein
MESILTSIKKMIGVDMTYTYFDPEIVMHINTVLSVLTQLGVGPTEGFSIQDENAIWSDFVGENPNLDLIKTFMGLKVKLFFDPPQASAHIEAINRQCDELEFRILATVNPREEEIQNG